MELAAFQEFFSVVKRSFTSKRFFYIKKSWSDLSHDVRKSFPANESYYFFFFVKDLKPVAVTYAFLQQVCKIDECF